MILVLVGRLNRANYYIHVKRIIENTTIENNKMIFHAKDNNISHAKYHKRGVSYSYTRAMKFLFLSFIKKQDKKYK